MTSTVPGISLVTANQLAAAAQGFDLSGLAAQTVPLGPASAGSPGSADAPRRVARLPIPGASRGIGSGAGSSVNESSFASSLARAISARRAESSQNGRDARAGRAVSARGQVRLSGDSGTAADSGAVREVAVQLKQLVNTVRETLASKKSGATGASDGSELSTADVEALRAVFAKLVSGDADPQTGQPGQVGAVDGQSLSPQQEADVATLLQTVADALAQAMGPDGEIDEDSLASALSLDPLALAAAVSLLAAAQAQGLIAAPVAISFDLGDAQADGAGVPAAGFGAIGQGESAPVASSVVAVPSPDSGAAPASAPVEVAPAGTVPVVAAPTVATASAVTVATTEAPAIAPTTAPAPVTVAAVLPAIAETAPAAAPAPSGTEVSAVAPGAADASLALEGPASAGASDAAAAVAALQAPVIQAGQAASRPVTADAVASLVVDAAAPQTQASSTSDAATVTAVDVTTVAPAAPAASGNVTAPAPALAGNAAAASPDQAALAAAPAGEQTSDTAVTAGTAASQAVQSAPSAQPAQAASSGGAVQGVQGVQDAQASTLAVTQSVQAAPAQAAIQAAGAAQGSTEASDAPDAIASVGAASAASAANGTDGANAAGSPAALAADQAPVTVGEPAQGATPGTQPVAAQANNVARTAAVGAPVQADALGDAVPVADIHEQVSPVIVRQARLVGSAGNQELVVRLDPDHLGPLHVRISLADGVLSVGLRTATADAQRALENALPQLRNALADAGLRLDRLDVSSNNGGNAGNTGSQRNLAGNDFGGRDGQSNGRYSSDSNGSPGGQFSGQSNSGRSFADVLFDQDGRPFGLTARSQSSSSQSPKSPTNVMASELAPAPGTLALSRAGYRAYGALRDLIASRLRGRASGAGVSGESGGNG